MEKEIKKKKSKSEKWTDRFDWLFAISDIVFFIPRLFGRLIRWIVDLF